MEKYFPEIYHIYKENEDIFEIFKEIAHLSGVSITNLVWKQLSLIKNGIDIFKWPFE